MSSSSMATPSTVLNACVKPEPQDITNYFPPLPENDDADLTKSVNDLGNLAAVIQAFKNRYDELQKHLDFIKEAIDEKSHELTASLPVTAIAGNSIGVSVQPVTENDGKRLDSAVISKFENVNESENKNKNKNENEIVTLCKTMDSRGLRRYVLTHLSDAEVALREQVPEALKSAPKPAKLVIECVGRFFLQGSKAYTKDSKMIRTRQASVLVLEYYLMSGCVESEKEVEEYLRKEAGLAAVQWRKRLIVEGGVAKAVGIDARGLLLFIAGFGIPSVFSNDDVLNLVRLSNPGEISQALRQSQALVKRVSAMAEGLVIRGMAVEVVDLAYTFGFEEKYSIKTMLTSFLQKSEEAWKEAKAKAQESPEFPNVLKVANEKYMNALKSVVNCLEGHMIDFEKLLPGWQLKDRIINMEKDISDINKKIQEKVVPKRKVDKNNSPNKLKIPEAKRSRFPEKDSYLASPSVTALQEQRMASHIDGNNSYDDLLVARYLDGRSYGYSNYYPTASSAQIRSVSGSLPESYLGGTVSGVGNMNGGGIAAPAMPAGIGAPSGSYSGYQGDMVMDNVGTMLNSNSHMYYSRWHGSGAGALPDERLVGQSFGGHHTVAGVNDLYGRTSTDGYSGYQHHPSVGVAGPSGGSDLYSFADSVLDR